MKMAGLVPSTERAISITASSRGVLSELDAFREGILRERLRRQKADATAVSPSPIG
ncbi:hypothetical protein ACFL5O_11510 [Myxococcota bacterium]